MDDTSLDDFLGSEDSDTADDDSENNGTPETVGDEDDEGDNADSAGATDETGDGITPATTTYQFAPAGKSCAACGETVTRRWESESGLVCGECKEW